MRGLLLLFCLSLAGIAVLAADTAKLTDQMKVVNYAIGPLVIGRVFPVSVTLNDYFAKLPGTRRWFVIREDYQSSNPSCQGTISGVDFPFLLVYQVFGQLPGSPDYRPGCKMYDNVTVTEEKVDGNTLTAKLQINDPSDQILGKVRLVCLFVDHPPASIQDGMDANARWDMLYPEIKSVRDLFFQQRSKLTREQQQAVADALTVTDGTLEGLPTNLRDEIVALARDAAMAKHKAALTPDQQMALATEGKIWADLQRKANYYSGIWTSITVKPFRLAIEKPEGWSDAGDAQDWTACTLKKTVTQKNASGNTMSADATVTIIANNDAAREKLLANSHSANYGKPITSGDFTGLRYTTTGPKTATSDKWSDDIIMKNGGLYLDIRIRISAAGPQADAHPIVETLSKEAESIIASLRLESKK